MQLTKAHPARSAACAYASLSRWALVGKRETTTSVALSRSARLDYEKEDYFGHRWWAVPEVLRSSERFYPGRLRELLGIFLDGQEADEPFELWS
jgi:hypothetical protein